jgi:hypothetical protein
MKGTTLCAISTQRLQLVPAAICILICLAACSSREDEPPPAEGKACDQYLDAIWNVDLLLDSASGKQVPQAHHYARFRKFCVSQARSLDLSAARIEACATAFRGRVGQRHCVTNCEAKVEGAICDLTLCANLQLSDEGGECTGSIQCGNGGYCEQGRCTVTGPDGAPCGIDAEGRFLGPDCRQGLVCQSGTCMRLLREGEACGIFFLPCGGAAYCKEGKCLATPLRAPGELCANDVLAACRDGLCFESSPEARCSQPIDEGQRCDPADATRRCRDFSVCRDGLCQPFETACSFRQTSSLGK